MNTRIRFQDGAAGVPSGHLAVRYFIKSKLQAGRWVPVRLPKAIRSDHTVLFLESAALKSRQSLGFIVKNHQQRTETRYVKNFLYFPIQAADSEIAAVLFQLLRSSQ